MSVNKVILIGNVGKDPDVKYFDNDSARASFSLATTERGYTAANGTQVPERTEWHNIVCWRGLAKVVEQFVKKGTAVYIEGKIRSRSYDDQNGVKRYVTEIVADNLELLGRRGAQSEDGTSSYAPSQSKAAPVAQEKNNPAIEPSSDADDLPF